MNGSICQGLEWKARSTMSEAVVRGLAMKSPVALAGGIICNRKEKGKRWKCNYPFPEKQGPGSPNNK